MSIEKKQLNDAVIRLRYFKNDILRIQMCLENVNSPLSSYDENLKEDHIYLLSKLMMLECRDIETYLQNYEF